MKVSLVKNPIDPVDLQSPIVTIALFFGAFKFAEGHKDWAAAFATEHFGALVSGGQVGATEAPNKVGEVLVQNMLRAQYRGALFCVNPKYRNVHGVPCFGSVSALPQVDYPTIVVATQLPGASAQTMATAVTTPLERQFGRIAGVTEMTSFSGQGGGSVVLQFDLGRNPDGAQRDVQAAINAAAGTALQAGDVLVAPSTDPAWTPLFLKASALVMETGGYLSHGAIVAREFGIPAVVNVPGIRARLKDGETIRVDGNTGTISRVSV